jgi:sulfatase maturation enzyme AslB (radical SAM superfamily)
MTKIIKLVEEKQLCSLPWVHTEIDLQNDYVKPCCKFTEKFGNVSDGFSTTWNNSYSNQLRQDLLNDINRIQCSSCNVGPEAFSYKKWKNDYYKNEYFFLDDSDTDIVETPHMFHINLSNTCNLACRMCDSTNSSKLAQMARKHDSMKGYLQILPHKKRISPEVLRGSFKNAKLVSFAGGEPTIDEDTLTVIKMIRSESTDITAINFSTNLTTINDDLLYELNDIASNKIVNVVLSISIDGPKHIHEYIRYHCSWDIMMSNIEYIKLKYPNIQFSANTTISAMNVGYVSDTLDSIHLLEKNYGVKIKRIMTSPVINKKYLHPGLLPEAIKQSYIDKIKSHDGDLTIKDSEYVLSTAIELLSKDYSTEREKFLNYMSEFDKIAGTSFIKTYPEFNYEP